MVEVGFSGLLFFGSFAFGELAGLFYQNIQVFFLLGSFGEAKEMNIIPKNERGCPFETPSSTLLPR